MQINAKTLFFGEILFVKALAFLAKKWYNIICDK